jgi:exodeoxyribonuclease VII large subunit
VGEGTSTRLVTKADDDLGCDREVVAEGARLLVEAARREFEASTRLVVGLGPQATLRRGFALARDGEGRPITSREAAIGADGFAVEFHDGAEPVAVLESREGEG